MSEPDPQQAGSRTRSITAFLVIALGCAALLAATVYFTRERIARNRAAEEAEGILHLTKLERPPATGTWKGDVWAACDGTLLMKGTAEGYGGPIHWLLAAHATPDGPRIGRVMVTEHHETPGIANFLSDPEHSWLMAFADHGADAAEVDTISGATITTRALARDIGARLGEPVGPMPECPP